jgi:hypothetical protein
VLSDEVTGLANLSDYGYLSPPRGFLGFGVRLWSQPSAHHQAKRERLGEITFKYFDRMIFTW